MAGSNQASNLEGLLRGLTGAFNQEDMGQGMMFAQNIRDYNAPVLDANDPNSVLDRQRWAQMNGYQKEAAALGATLGNLRKAEQQEADRAEYNRMLSALSQLDTQRQNALDGLTVPGGGPPSPQQVADVNANFDAARDKLAYRIDEQAAKIEGASGTAGADAVANNEKARRIEDILINNGLGDYTEMAPYMEYKDVQELLKNKGKLGGKRKTGTIKRYANGSISTAYEDGTASILTPEGNIVLSDADPEEYQAALDESIASGPELDALAYRTEQLLDEEFQVRKDLRLSVDAAINSYQDLKFIEENTNQYLTALNNGDLSTNPIKGWINQFGWADAKTGELQADAVYQTLLNLQITRLAPVSNYEIGLIQQMFVDPKSMTSANLGRAKSALKRISLNLGKLDNSIATKIEEARYYDDDYADRQAKKWDQFKNGYGSTSEDGTDNLSPDPYSDDDVLSRADAILSNLPDNRGPQ